MADHPVRCDQFKAFHAVRGKTELAAHNRHPAAHGITDNPHIGRGTAQTQQAMGRCRVKRFPPFDPGTDRCQTGHGINFYLPEPLGADQYAPIDRGHGPVPGTIHPDGQAIGRSIAEGRGHIFGAICDHHQRRAVPDRCVPRISRLAIFLAARAGQHALQHRLLSPCPDGRYAARQRKCGTGGASGQECPARSLIVVGFDHFRLPADFMVVIVSIVRPTGPERRAPRLHPVAAP